MTEDRGQGSKQPATERAEDLLNRAGWSTGLLASMIGTRLVRVAAFAREEAEDMWAEAKSIRQQRLQGEDNAETEATPEGADAPEREAEEEHEAKPEHPTETDSDTEPQENNAPEATPAARHHAEELGVDLQEVEGTGAGGHITLEDVEKKAESEE